MTGSIAQAPRKAVAADTPGINDAPVAVITSPTTPIGSERLVNTTTAGPQQTPMIAALDDGGYVVLWASGAADFSDTSITGQRYAADGTPVGNEFVVDALGQFDFTNLSVSGLDGGGFVVAWQDVVIGEGRIVAAQMYDAQGIATGNRLQLTTPGEAGYPVVAALEGGGFVVTWLRVVGGDGIDVMAQRFDASGTALGASFVATPVTTGTQNFQNVAGLADGGFVVTWTSFGSNSDATQVFAQRYDDAGVAVGGQFLVPTSQVGGQSASQITALSNGGFVISWNQRTTNADVDIRARIYDASGNPAGPEFQANSTAYGSMSTVTALTDGGFVISWISSNVSNEADIYAQRFDANGATVGSAVQVNAVNSFEQTAPVAAGLTGGGFAVAWTSIGQDGSSAGIYSQRYDTSLAAIENGTVSLKNIMSVSDPDAGSAIVTATVSVNFGILNVAAGTSGAIVAGSGTASVTITGTIAQINALLSTNPTSSVSYLANEEAPGDEATLQLSIDDGGNTGTGGPLTATATKVIALTVQNDTLTGTSNADTLNGMGGDDAVNGLGGDDTLSGGSGHDLINGGSGADAMYGGTGNDIYRVDNANDSVIESANEGYDSVYTGVSWVMNEGQEIELLATTNAAGTTAINLTGNALANEITGNAGNNVLSGASGDDVLNGGAGEDTLDGGTGADIMTGGSGEDYYFVDDAGDQVFEASSGGIEADSVFASASWTLAAGQEIERIRAIPGSDDIDLTGNEYGQKIQGNDGSNIFNGGGGADSLDGGAGADTLNGGTGDDKLNGGDGADIFVVTTGTGTDRITDFTPGTDRIDVSALGMTWAAVQAAMSEAGGHTTIDLGGGNALSIRFTAIAQLQQSDFIVASGAEPIKLGAGIGDFGFDLIVSPVIEHQPLTDDIFQSWHAMM